MVNEEASAIKDGKIVHKKEALQNYIDFIPKKIFL